MESTINIFKKSFLAISFCAFLYIALGFSLQQSSLGGVHLCPYASDIGSTCIMNNLTHAQHWLSFITFSIPEVFGVIVAIALLFLFVTFKKHLFEFFNTIKISFKRNNFSPPELAYSGNIFSIGTIGSRAP